MSFKIAVIAGTPIDTQMGVDFLKSKKSGFEILCCPLERNPRDCHVYQMLPEEQKYQKMKQHMQKYIDLGANAFFIYCNSLSSSVDFAGLAKDLNTICITTLDAYKIIAKKYNCCGIIAANNQATAGIEKTLTNENPDCYCIGTGILSLVEDIEKSYKNPNLNISPTDIIEKHDLKDLFSFYKKNGANVIILGCTHFPYLKSSLPDYTDLEIVDPADIMYRLISDACRSL